MRPPLEMLGSGLVECQRGKLHCSRCKREQRRESCTNEQGKGFQVVLLYPLKKASNVAVMPQGVGGGGSRVMEGRL